ncbi:hypothetical protein P4O66_007302 [Electrophorus voltai]|uniref:Uncharacterized protein n=1 Tax=Electrophorus voltai TaxID=2609070 RepID=A0AAD9E1I4_9TELE|nr:hypothetical protein P4O66_007302 [Electrophorus voltai]
MVVDQPAMDQDVESYNEGQEFYYDLRSEAGSEHTISFHHSMEELPLEALSEVESEYSVDSRMEVEASTVPKPTKGTCHSNACVLLDSCLLEPRHRGVCISLLFPPILAA